MTEDASDRVFSTGCGLSDGRTRRGRDPVTPNRRRRWSRPRNPVARCLLLRWQDRPVGPRFRWADKERKVLA